MSLDGQTAVVTGGGRGIGRAICLELADRGADVCAADVDEDGMADTVQAVEDLGGRAWSFATDLRDPDSVAATRDDVLATADSVEILVNNAGIAGPTAPCEEVSVAEWDETLHVNLRGAFLMCRAFLPHMKEREYGRIVNISSLTAKRPLHNRTPYAASKMGLVGFTRTLAEETGEFDVNANTICPGSVEGPRLFDVFEKQAEARGLAFEEVKREAVETSPRDELVQPEDVGRLVSFLCSSDADRITGQDVNVSAGRLMH